MIREFCWAHGIERFHDVGDHGIIHQLVVERGYVHPGMLVIGSDSHTNMAGALAAFAAGIGVTETAAVMATGKLWLKVPETLDVRVDGSLARRTGAKDVILKVIQTTGDDGASYKAVEFHGDTIRGFPMNERFVLSNMTTEMGAKAGMVPADGTTREDLRELGAESEALDADSDARSLRPYDIDVGRVGPQVACPTNPAHL